MLFNLKPVKTYKFTKENLDYLFIDNDEKFFYKLNKFINNKAIFTGMTVLIGTLGYVEKAFASPTTGIPKLDAAGWKMVNIMQSVVFWAAMIFTFKSLLEWALKGSDEGKKKVGIGFIICVCDYLIPWGFDLIRGIFK